MANASIYEYDVSKRRYSSHRSIAGGREDWAEINKALREVPGMWELFTTNIMKAIGNWNELYSKLIGDITDDTSGHIKSTLKLQNRTFSIGGNVAENAAAAIAVRLNQLRGGNSSMEYSISGGALTVEGPATADSFIIFSADSTISADDIFNELNSATDATYKEKLNNTVVQFKNNLNTLFGIFINAKNYSIGKEQTAEYTKTLSGTFEELPATFNEL